MATSTLEEAGRAGVRTPSGIRLVHYCWSCRGEDLVELDYQPGKCVWDHRVMMLRNDSTGSRGAQVLFDELRSLSYITTGTDLSAADVVACANGRCDQENVIEQFNNGVGGLRVLEEACVNQQTFVSGGVTDPQGERDRFGARLVGCHDDEPLRHGGQVGTAADEQTLEQLGGLLARCGRLCRHPAMSGCAMTRT